jgi:peptidoglycan hydrolase-like protein with peptidoglycan-binding domain
MTPEQIRMIQERLSALGYRVPITGMMDAATQQAISAYNTIQRPRDQGSFTDERYPKGDFTLGAGQDLRQTGDRPNMGSGLSPYGELGPVNPLPPMERSPYGELGPVNPLPSIERTRSVSEPVVAQDEGPSFPNHPMPMRRPFSDAPEPVRRPMPASRPRVDPAPMNTEPSSRELFSRMDNDGSHADFFRADRAMMEGRAAGGRAPSPGGGKHDAVSKALEIIHHLITRGR